MNIRSLGTSPSRWSLNRGRAQRSIGFDVRRWSQCSAGKSKKASKASRSFVRQATAFSYLAPYLSANTSIAASAARAGWRAVDFTKVCFHVGLDRAGDLVQHIGGLMDPTSLMPGAGKDLLDCLPEAERPVVDRGCTGAGGETARSEMLAVMPSPPGPPMTLGNMRMLGPCSRTASANALPEAGAPPDMSARPSRGDALRNAVSGGPCVGCFFDPAQSSPTRPV